MTTTHDIELAELVTAAPSTTAQLEHRTRRTAYAELGGRALDALYVENAPVDPHVGSSHRPDRYIDRIAQRAVRIAQQRSLVVIPCGGNKADHTAPAVELYVGAMFTLSLKAARAMVPDDRIVILSGRFGFVGTDTVLVPYEQRIDAAGAVTDAELHASAQRQGIVGVSQVTFLLPKAYDAAARAVFPDAINLLTGSRSIFEQRARLSNIVKGAA